MKCPQCQFENRIERLYCEGCGAPIEHDLRDVQQAVDKEIRDEKAKATSHGVRWLLATGIVLAFVGYYFRAAYKELPENDIVAFATAPTTQINDRVTVTTDRFGVPLPPLKTVRAPNLRRGDLTPKEEIEKQAYRRAAVRLKRRGSKNFMEGLLLGDLIVYVKLPGSKEPVAVHIADVRHLRPSPGGLFEIQAVNLPTAVKVAIPNHRKVRIKLLEPQAGADPVIHEIPLVAVQSIDPANPSKP